MFYMQPTILIVYSSVGGNTELTVTKVKEVLSNFGISVDTARCVTVSPSDLEKYSLVVLASPTYYHGLLEDHFSLFIAKLQQTPEIITDKKFSIIGLGDKKYDLDYTTEAASILEQFIKENNGVLAHPSLRINGYPLSKESTIIKWAERLAKVVNEM